MRVNKLLLFRQVNGYYQHIGMNISRPIDLYVFVSTISSYFHTGFMAVLFKRGLYTE